MLALLLRKLGAALVVLTAASILVFVGVRSIPGNTADVLAGAGADAATRADIRHEYLLDRPVPVQYAHWVGQVVRGHLGQDEHHNPVAARIASRIPISLELAVLALLFAVTVGIPLGVWAASRRSGVGDHLARAVALAGQSVPHFWLGLLLIIWFAVDLHWLPASGYVSIVHPIANLRHLVLPAIVLGTGIAAVLVRQTRSAMLTALSNDYIVTARAKGLGEHAVLWRHALRDSLITVTTLITLDFGLLISGAAVTETIFGIHGVGHLMLEAVAERDYTLIQGIVLLTAVVFVLVNAATDVLYMLLDPRIRLGARR